MRHYYAEWCPYGVDTISYDDQLCQFRTRDDRDDFVAMCNRSADYYGHDFAAPVTLRQVAHKYPFRSIWADWHEENFTCRYVRRYYWTLGVKHGYRP